MTETELIYRIGNFSIFLLQDKDHSPKLACVTLLCLLVLTLILNSFVLLSVLFSNLRSSPYNVSVATLAAVSLLDGIFNVTSSIVFHASWIEFAEQYGETTAREWCRANAMTLQFTGMIQSFVFAILVYDRQSIFSIRNEQKARKRNIVLKWALFVSVVASVIMALPIWFGIFTTTLFDNRMSCGPAYVTTKPLTVLLAILIIVTYLSTWLFTLRVSFLIVRQVLNNRRRLIDLNLVARQRGDERNTFRGTPNPSTELWSRASWNKELPVYILTGLLTVSYMLTVSPNIIAVQITQFYEIYDESSDFYYPNQTLPPLELRQIETNLFDSIFSWTRYGYNVFLPIAIFFMHGEIRKQCKMTFCCCDIIPQFTKGTRTKTIADNATPVLFSTSEGLHLRISENHILNEEPLYLVKFCDLVLNEPRETTVETRRKTFVKSGKNVRTEPRLNETFVVTPRKSLTDTYVKLTNELDISRNSRDRKGTIELHTIAENSNSLLGQSQRKRNSDS